MWYFLESVSTTKIKDELKAIVEVAVELKIKSELFALKCEPSAIASSVNLKFVPDITTTDPAVQDKIRCLFLTFNVQLFKSVPATTSKLLDKHTFDPAELLNIKWEFNALKCDPFAIASSVNLKFEADKVIIDPSARRKN